MAIDSLPQVSKWRGKGGVLLPQFGGGAGVEVEEEVEEEEDV